MRPPATMVLGAVIVVALSIGAASFLILMAGQDQSRWPENALVLCTAKVPASASPDTLVVHFWKNECTILNGRSGIVVMPQDDPE